MNTDAEIFNKKISNLYSTIFLKNIHHDKVGFIPELQA